MAPTRISSDSLDRERRGRIIGEDQHKGAIRARARELMQMSGGRSGAGAAAAPASTFAAPLGGGKGASREAVLKVFSWTKDSASPMAQARYASRTRDSDPPAGGLLMVNEEGRELRGVQIEAEVRSWNLKTEAQNQSAAAKRATPAERRDMPAAERLDKRQAVHMIFSVPSHARADAERLGRAVDLALGETVREGGFRYVYTIHTDHSARPHAHIVIKAQSEPFEKDGIEKTRQLRLGPKELDAMRQVMTRHAQEHGLNVIATRRQDREHMRADILAGQAPLHENMKFHQTMKQTRQGRTFEVKAPSWYAENGLDYERRRLAAVGVEKPGKGSAKVPTAGQGSPAAETAPEKRARGLLGRVFDRALGRGRGAELEPSPSAPKTALEAASKGRGYFENFDKNRNDTSPAQPKPAAEQKIAAHFAVTHREPDKAAASFRAMFKESPRLALWAAGKHPQAFGEPTGREGPGLALKDVRTLTSAAPRFAPPPRSAVLDPFSQEAALAGERILLREATARARAKAAPGKAERSMTRSLVRLADRIERETPTDPDSKERAAHIRNVARTLNRSDGVTKPQYREQAERIHDAAGGKDKAALYRELEEQLRQRDQARAKHHTRDPASPEPTIAPGGPKTAPTAPVPKRGSYFQNFDNYRTGASAAEPKIPAERKTAADPAATPKAPAKEASENKLSMALTRLANRIERQSPGDSAIKEQATHIREVARNLKNDPAARTQHHREQAERIHDAAGGKDKASLYRELEEQLRQRDQARAKHRPRDRDDGGRDR